MMAGEILPAPRAIRTSRVGMVWVAELPIDKQEKLLTAAKMQAKGLRQVQGLEAIFRDGSLTFETMPIPARMGTTFGARVSGGTLSLTSWRALCSRLLGVGLRAKSETSGDKKVARLYYIGVKDENLPDVYSFFA